MYTLQAEPIEVEFVEDGSTPPSSRFDRFKKRVSDLPRSTRKKIRWTLISCLLFSVLVLVLFYAFDYLDMSTEEKAIFRWYLDLAAE